MDGSEENTTALRIHALRQRVEDIASYLEGMVAVIECMNKGAAENIEVAIQALRALSVDMEEACKPLSEPAPPPGT